MRVLVIHKLVKAEQFVIVKERMLKVVLNIDGEEGTVTTE
jgi:hypothetical protein